MAFAVEFFASIAKPYESFFVLDRYMNQDCLDVRWTVRCPEILGNPYIFLLVWIVFAVWLGNVGDVRPSSLRRQRLTWWV